MNDRYRPQTAYNRQYLPGYTGFVPNRSDMFGLTAGEINR